MANIKDIILTIKGVSATKSDPNIQGTVSHVPVLGSVSQTDVFGTVEHQELQASLTDHALKSSIDDFLLNISINDRLDRHPTLFKKILDDVLVWDAITDTLFDFGNTPSDNSLISEFVEFLAMYNREFLEIVGSSEVFNVGIDKVVDETSTTYEVINKDIHAFFSDMVTSSENFNAAFDFQGFSEYPTDFNYIIDDFLSILTAHRTLTDQLSAANYVTFDVSTNLSDVSTTTDVFTSHPDKLLSDTSTTSHTMIFDVGLSLSDLVSLTENINTSLSQAGALDTQDNPTISESITLIWDALRDFLDTSSISEVVSIHTDKLLTDDALSSEILAFIWTIQRDLLDNVINTESINFDVGLNLSENTLTSEVVSTLWTAFATLSEDVITTELTYKDVGKVIDGDQALTSEIFVKDVSSERNDNTITSEFLSMDISVLFSDTVNLIEDFITDYSGATDYNTSDTSNITEILSLEWTIDRAFNETTNISEDIAKAISTELSDLATLSETLTMVMGYGLLFTDNATSSEALSFDAFQVSNENIVSSETLEKAISSVLEDIAVATDTLTYVWSATLAPFDNVISSEVFSLSLDKPLSENIALTEVLNLSIGLDKSELISETEVFSFDMSKELSEVINTSEIITKHKLDDFWDDNYTNIDITEVFERTWDANLSFQDNPIVSEVFSGEVGKYPEELLTTSETLNKDFSKILEEFTTLSEVILLEWSALFDAYEYPITSEIIENHVQKVLSEDVVLTESFTTDWATSDLEKSLEDFINLTEELVKDISTFYNEVLTLSETIENAVSMVIRQILGGAYLGPVTISESGVTTVTRYVNPNSSGGDGTTNATSGANAAYVSLSAWHTARQRNLVSANEIELVVCESNGAADTTILTFGTNSWVTDSTHYVVIQAGASHRASTKWSTSKYRLEITSTNGAVPISVASEPKCLRIDGIQISNDITLYESPTRYSSLIAFNPSSSSGAVLHVRNCYVRYKGLSNWSNLTGSGSLDGIYAAPNTISPAVVPNIYVYNNIIHFDVQGILTYTNIPRAIRLEHRAHNGYIFNNTVVGAWGLGSSGDDNSVRLHYLKNNIFKGLITATSENISRCNYNSTDLASLGYGASANDRVNQVFKFKDVDDFQLLRTDTGAKGYGQSDPGSGLYNRDIDNYERTGSWDIGADSIALNVDYDDSLIEELFTKGIDKEISEIAVQVPTVLGYEEIRNQLAQPNSPPVPIFVHENCTSIYAFFAHRSGPSTTYTATLNDASPTETHYIGSTSGTDESGTGVLAWHNVRAGWGAFNSLWTSTTPNDGPSVLLVYVRGNDISWRDAEYDVAITTSHAAVTLTSDIGDLVMRFEANHSSAPPVPTDDGGGWTDVVALPQVSGTYGRLTYKISSGTSLSLSTSAASENYPSIVAVSIKPKPAITADIVISTEVFNAAVSNFFNETATLIENFVMSFDKIVTGVATATVTDDFNRANETLNTGDWSGDSYWSSFPLEISSNKAVASNASGSCSIWVGEGAAFKNGSVSVNCKLGTAGESSTYYLIVRQKPGYSGIRILLDYDSAQACTYTVMEGFVTKYGPASVSSASHTIKFILNEQSISAYCDGVLKHSYTSSETPDVGEIKLNCGKTSAEIIEFDDFSLSYETGAPVETVIASDSSLLEFGKEALDNLILSEVLSTAVDLNLLTNSTVSEIFEKAISLQLSDIVNLTEDFVPDFSPGSLPDPSPTDNPTITESGTLNLQNYVEGGYLAEDFVGTNTTF